MSEIGKRFLNMCQSLEEKPQRINLNFIFKDIVYRTPKEVLELYMNGSQYDIGRVTICHTKCYDAEHENAHNPDRSTEVMFDLGESGLRALRDGLNKLLEPDTEKERLLKRSYDESCARLKIPNSR